MAAQQRVKADTPQAANDNERDSLEHLQRELCQLQIAKLKGDARKAQQVATEPAKRWSLEPIPQQIANANELAYWDNWHRTECAFPRIPEDGCFLLVTGRKGIHKSGVMLKECLDATQRKQARVLYIATEGGHGIITERLPLYCKRRGLKVEDIADKWRVLKSAPNLLNEGDVERFCEHVLKLWGPPDIVVIDVLTKGIGSASLKDLEVGGGIVSGAEQMARLFDGATVIGVTHPPKGAKSDGQAQGSGQQENLAYGVLRVLPDKDLKNGLFLQVAHMKDGPAGHKIPLRLDWPEGQPPVVVEAERALATEGDKTAVLTVLRGAPEGLSRKAVEEQIREWDANRVGRALTGLATDGLATKGKGHRGKWFACDPISHTEAA